MKIAVKSAHLSSIDKRRLESPHRAKRRAGFGVSYQCRNAHTRYQVIAFTGENPLGHRQSIGHFAKIAGFTDRTTEFSKLVIHKADVKRCIVGNQLGPFDEVYKLLMDIFVLGLIFRNSSVIP